MVKSKSFNFAQLNFYYLVILFVKEKQTTCVPYRQFFSIEFEFIMVVFQFQGQRFCYVTPLMYDTPFTRCMFFWIENTYNSKHYVYDIGAYPHVVEAPFLEK